jgi:hypothetical protein
MVAKKEISRKEVPWTWYYVLGVGYADLISRLEVWISTVRRRDEKMLLLHNSCCLSIAATSRGKRADTAVSVRLLRVRR